MQHRCPHGWFHEAIKEDLDRLLEEEMNDKDNGMDQNLLFSILIGHSRSD